MAVLEVEAHPVLGDPHYVGEQAELFAAAGEVVGCRSHAGLEVVVEAFLEITVVEIEIVDATIELDGAPAALAERLEDLGAIPGSVLVAARLAGQEVASLEIAAPEARIAAGHEGSNGGTGELVQVVAEVEPVTSS